MAAVTRRQYKGAAAQTTITNSLASGDTSITIAATTGWPSTAAVPFYVVISPGTSSEEKCLATISGSTLTLTRAQDDTTAASHSSGATIYPVFTADDADEANKLASTLTTRGDLLTMGSGPDFARLAIGAANTVLKSDGTDASWGTVGSANLAAGAVGTTQLGSLTVNDQTDNYTLVAGDVNKRVVMNKATSSTITVPNSVFSAGQVVYIANKGAGTCTVTAGAGTTVSTTGTLALAQYATGTLIALSASAFIYEAGGITATAAGLTLISSTTIGSGVSSVVVSDAFSSTYDNYKITVSGGACSTDSGLNLQLGSTTTGYYGAQSYVTYSTGATSTDGRNNQASFIDAGVARSDYLSLNIDLFSPNLAKYTTYYGWKVTQSQGGYSVGVLQNTTTYTAFTLLVSGGATMTGGTIRVYGYANS